MAISYNSNYYTTNSPYSTSSTTYSTAGDQVWYLYDEEGNLRQGGQPSHTHEMPSHNHSNWGGGTWQQSPRKILESQPNDDVVFYGKDGKELMKLNDGIQMKVSGKWIKVEEYLERLDQLDSMMERMYELLSPYQRKKLMFSQLEKQEEDFEHFDQDLFKV